MKRVLMAALFVFASTGAMAFSVTPWVGIDLGGARNVIVGCGHQGHVGVIRVRAGGGFFHNPGAMRKVRIRAQHPDLWEVSTGGGWTDWRHAAPHVFSVGQHRGQILISVRRKPGSHHDGGVWSRFHLEYASDDRDFRLGGSPPAFYVVDGGPGCDGEADDLQPISEDDDLLSNPISEGNTRSTTQ